MTKICLKFAVRRYIHRKISMNRILRNSGFGLLLALLGDGCVGDPGGDAAGPTISGGKSASDLSAGSGGSAGTTGDDSSTASAGNTGQPGFGGYSVSGGSTSSGGSTTFASSTTLGGATAFGGTTRFGGSLSSSGSLSSGGSINSGGSTRFGGSISSGGTTSSGGSTRSGGATNSGGATSSGGVFSSGGSTVSGGSTASGRDAGPPEVGQPDTLPADTATPDSGGSTNCTPAATNIVGAKHYAGQICMNCHKAGGDSPRIYAAGTIYTTAAGGTAVGGATVKIGSTTMVTDKGGTFYTTSAVTLSPPTAGKCPSADQTMTTTPTSADCNGCHKAGSRIHLP
jgi:hypothetical protein